MRSILSRLGPAVTRRSTLVQNSDTIGGRPRRLGVLELNLSPLEQIVPSL